MRKSADKVNNGWQKLRKFKGLCSDAMVTVPLWP